LIRRLLALFGIGLGAAGLADRTLARGILGQPPSTRAIRSLAVVEAPIDRVWAAISDIPAQPRWMHEMKAVRLTTPGPIGVGTRGDADVRIFGIGVTDPVELTEWEPPTRFAIRHEGLFTGGGVITLRPGADGTTTIVTWDETLVAPGFPELGGLVQRPILGRIFQDDLHRFRELVESGDWERGRA
jgi:uncharacterized membrane protein